MPSELIERLEKATGNDPELIGRAFLALNPVPRDSLEALKAHSAKAMRFKRMLDAEAYESAALTLVPSGKGHDPWWMLKAAWRGIAKAEVWVNGKGRPYRGEATTPALAICIAALRAKEAGHE